MGSLATDTNDDYNYDVFGNMIKDENKAINSIKYNHLNLPTEIQFTYNRKINYTYDATGIKLKKVVFDGTYTTTTNYLDGYQYENKPVDLGGFGESRLQFFPTSEGYVKPIYSPVLSIKNAKYQYVYNHTDHLGNVRVSYSKVNGEIKVLEENNYYPFGLKHANYNQTRNKLTRKISNDQKRITPTNVNGYKYKYNGKELQDEFNLNMYDLGARGHDPARVQFGGIDPRAEEYYSQSPYVFASNNPIFYVDVNGMSPEDYYFVNKDGSMNIIKTDDKIDYFYVENRQGNGYTFTAALEKNSAGLVKFPSSDGLWDSNYSRYGQIDSGGNSTNPSEVVGEGDHYLKPQTAASLFGLANELDEHNISPSFGDMSSSNGSDPWQSASFHHAGHGHNGKRTGLDVDFRYISKAGKSFKSTNAFNSNDFSQKNNQLVYDLAKKYGFTKNYQGLSGSLSGSRKISNHNNHGHLGYTGRVKTITWNNAILQSNSLPFSPTN